MSADSSFYKDKKYCKGFPDRSVSNESTCNTGDPGLIPRLGRSAGEGIGYPLQYSWASLVAQLVKNPHASKGLKFFLIRVITLLYLHTLSE